jgi:hypothetical protein
VSLRVPRCQGLSTVVVFFLREMVRDDASKSRW